MKHTLHSVVETGSRWGWKLYPTGSENKAALKAAASSRADVTGELQHALGPPADRCRFPECLGREVMEDDEGRGCVSDWPKAKDHTHVIDSTNCQDINTETLIVMSNYLKHLKGSHTHIPV